MGLGSVLFYSIGAAFVWIMANIARLCTGKPAISFPNVWKAGKTDDPIDDMAHELKYKSIGFVVVSIIIVLILNLK